MSSNKKNWASRTKHELILRTVAQLVWSLLHDDRKQDTVLPVGSIEEAIYAGTITIDEIAEYFREELEKLI